MTSAAHAVAARRPSRLVVSIAAASGVLRRDLLRTLTTTVGPLVLSLWCFITSLFFWLQLQDFEQLQQRALVVNDADVLAMLDFNDLLLGGVFNHVQVVLLFVVPLLTMRAFADEHQQGTIDLLRLSPASSTSIALGKLGAPLVVVSLLVAWLGVFGALLAFLDAPLAGSAGAGVDVAQLGCGMLATWAVACVAVVVGVLSSALVGAAITSALASFLVLLLAWFLPVAGERVGGDVGAALAWASPQHHVEELTRGVLVGADLSYFLVVIGVGVAAVVYAVHRERR